MKKVSNVSSSLKKKQIIFGLIVLVLILGIVEVSANVWWNEINTCAFEESEVFDEISEVMKDKLCQEHMNLRFLEDRIDLSAQDPM